MSITSIERANRQYNISRYPIPVLEPQGILGLSSQYIDLNTGHIIVRNDQRQARTKFGRESTSAPVTHTDAPAHRLCAERSTQQSLIDIVMFKLYRPSSTPDPTFPFVVYPSSLFSLGLGYALWYPEPHETGESQIGDVGYVNDGAFIRLFNINDSKPEHQVTFWHTPFKITNPLPGSENVFRPNKQHRAIDDGPYLSRGVQEKETHGSISV